MRRKQLPRTGFAPPGRRIGLLVKLGTIMLVACVLFCLFDAKIQPVLQQMAQYECYSITVAIMNQAVSQQIAQEPDLYDSLYSIQTDDRGVVRAVLAEPSVINRVRLDLAEAVDQALQALPEQEIYIPLGSLTDYALLNDLGPDWQLNLSPQGYVETEIEETAEELAINRTLYRVELVLRVTINMLLDGTSSSETVEHRVPISSILITGETPTYYANEAD